MTRPLRASPSRLRVYALLSEGKAQAFVAGQLGMSTGTIGYHAKELEVEGYLQRVKGTKNPVLYEKGPKGTDLDKLIIDSNIRINGTGVKRHSKNVATIPKANVHHLKLKLNVLDHGDIEEIKDLDGNRRLFLKQYQDYRNVKRWKGKIPHGDALVSVEYEETPRMKTFYIYPPEMHLSIEEIDQYEERAVSVCCDIAAYIQSVAGWKFGLPELTDWQQHFAVDTPEFMKNLAQKYFMRSQDGKTWTSNSNGASEIETSDVEQVKILLELPGQVIEMKGTLNELVKNMQLVTAALKETEAALASVANINGELVRKEAQATIDKVNTRVQQVQAEVAQAAPDKPYDGVMFG